MKKNLYFLLFTFVLSMQGFAQFTESFESATLPASWTLINGGDANTWTPIDYTGSTQLTAHTGSYAVGIMYTTPTAHDDYLISPAITVTAGVNDRFSFWGRSRDPLYPEQIDVMISTTTPTAAAFSIALQSNVAPPSGASFYYYSYDLTAYIGQTIYIGFHSTTMDMFYFDIDDVVSDAMPACSEPVNLQVSNITDNSATLTWNPIAGSVNYEYVLDNSPADPTSGTSTTTPSFSASSLDPTTTYYFHVRNNCDAAGFSSWTTISFTTTAIPTGCLEAMYGLYPSATFTPSNCDGFSPNVITTLGYASEYSNVNVTSGQTYVFSSSVATDFVTISTDDGVTATAYGTTPLTWVSTVSGPVRFYIHADAACGDNDDFRTRAVTCGVQSTDEPDYANLQFPATINVVQGNSEIVYGQVYEAGLTDVAPNIDGQAPGIEAWVGISPEGSNTDPSTWTNWTVADFNALHVSNNDEYMLAIGGNLAPGTYYYATRFRLNTGPFVYGGTDGTNGNFWDGTTYMSGVLTVTAAPVPVNDECAGAIALTPAGTFEAGAITTNNYSSSYTDTNVPDCQSNVLDNVWYSVIVPDSGNITIQTESVDGSPFTDSIIVAYSGTCGALTAIDCNDDDDNGLFSTLALVGQTPGSTIYVSVWRYSFGIGQDGQFQIAAYDASLANPTFDISRLSYYPNPVTDVLNLTAPNEISTVSVFNLLGQKVMATTVNATEANVNMSTLSAGTYVVKVMANNEVKTLKIVKQ